MSQRSEVSWAALILIFVGLFGVAVAVTALWSELPAPAAGGTCGPGRGSETAIEALVNPGSIGAGAEPPTSRAAARIQWNQFVDQCQSATDDRALLAFPVLVVSAGIAVMGFVLLRRRGGRSADGASSAQPEATWSPPPDTLFAMSSPLVSPPPATVAGGAYRTFDAPPPPPSGAPSPPPPPPPPPLPPVSPPPPPAAHGPLPWGPPGHPGDPPA